MFSLLKGNMLYRLVDNIVNAKFPETMEMEITEAEYNGEVSGYLILYCF